MAQDERSDGAATVADAADPAGIEWEAGDEDYPFAAILGETALDYFARWVDQAGYARVEQGGVRYIHETDVANFLNHVTADVGLLRNRLEAFGDRVVTAEAFDDTLERLERAASALRDATDTLNHSRG